MWAHGVNAMDIQILSGRRRIGHQRCLIARSSATARVAERLPDLADSSSASLQLCPTVADGSGWPCTTFQNGPRRKKGINAAACFGKSIFPSDSLSRLPASGLGDNFTHG
jgi:hypothetical protein